MDISSITAIILNYNSSLDTIELYRQLKNFHPELKIQIVDNNSDAQQIAKLNSTIDKREIIYSNKNLGYAGGNNIGILEALSGNAKFIWILNPDIRVNKDTLLLMLQIMLKDDNIAATGPRICYRSNKNVIYSDGGFIDRKNGYITSHKNHYKNVKDIKLTKNFESVDYVNGSVILLRVSAIRTVGLFLTKFFLYFEETEWCLRAKNQGFKLGVNSEAIAYHLESEKGKVYYYYMTRNRVLLAKMDDAFYLKTLKLVFQDIIRPIKASVKLFKIPSKKSLWMLQGLISGILTK